MATKLIKDINPKEWKKIKIYAMQNELKMGDALNNIIKDYFKRYKADKGKNSNV